MNNRHQRLAAARQARRNQAATPPPANLSAQAAEHLALAVQNHQGGQAQAARHLYEQVLAHDPRNIDALNLLGVLLHQLGDLDAAADHIAQAVKLYPASPELHYNLGNVRRDQQRYHEAADCFSKAKALSPDYFEAIFNLGVVLQLLGQDTEAIQHLEHALSLNDSLATGHCLLADIRFGRCEIASAIGGYRKALALDPDFAEAHNNLAVALLETGKDEDAQHHLEHALALDPDYVDAHRNLALFWQARAAPDRAEHHFRRAREHAAGDIRPDLGLGSLLHDQGRLDEALHVYRQALVGAPQSAAIFNNLGGLYRDMGQAGEAVAAYEQAMRVDPAFAGARTNLAHALRAQGRVVEAIAHYRDALASGHADDGVIAGLALALAFLAPTEFDPTLYELVLACFRGQGVRHQDLAPIAATLILHKYGPDWAPGEGDASLTEFAQDAVVLALLDHTINTSPALEKLLTACRRHLLFIAAGTTALEPEPEALRVMAALACQGHNNGYVFAFAPDEQTTVDAIRTRLLATEGGSAELSPELLALAMYQPLTGLPWLVDQPPVASPSWWRRLLELTVSEPAAETRLRAEIPALGAVADTTSRAVQQQYEDNPYPRWLSLRHEQSISLARRLAIINPALALDSLAGMSDVLIAGCGTGQQPIQFARTNRDVDVLAVDLSRASLAYAKRMAAKHEVPNIHFMQADILDLPSLARTFPVIECVGVLHHMADPAAGLAVLTGLLTQGGFLRLGLYSSTARRHVLAVQDTVRQRRLEPTPDNIRAFRQELLAKEQTTPPTHPVRIPDFYDLSGCRDLLFHVQERDYTLPQIAEFLASAGLAFVGFDFDDPSVMTYFQAQHPAPEALVDFRIWADFEAQYPEVFIGMYQFWCRKLP